MSRQPTTDDDTRAEIMIANPATPPVTGDEATGMLAFHGLFARREG